MRVQLFFTHRLAGDVAADMHMILAERLAMQHRIIADDLVDLQRGDAAAARHFFHQLLRDRTDLVLRIEQHGHHRRALAPGWIALQQLGEALFEGGGKGHRSTSPSPKSMLRMMAMESAMGTPSSMAPSACRLPKLGVRMKTRWGLAVPSLTT